MNKKQLIVAWVIVTLLSPVYCHSKEPELKKVVDSQGNVYGVDENGAIYSDGVPKPGRQAASAENIGYYLNESVMLESNGYHDEAYKMYSEILSLTETEESVRYAQYAIRLRITKIYNDETMEFRDLLKKYFSIKKLSNGNIEIKLR